MTEPSIGLKRCGGCGETKSLEEFHRDKNRKDGRVWNCKVCVRAYQQSIAERMKENRTARKARDPQKYAQGDRRATKKWRNSNREQALATGARYREENREKTREADRQWKKRNPDKNAAKARRYRAQKVDAAGEHTTAEIADMYRDQNGLCAYCEAALDNDYHVDHMTPLSRGGRDDWTNLAISCGPCNTRKYNRTAEEYVGVFA